MSYQFIADLDPVSLDQFNAKSPLESIYQCSSWAQIKKEWTHAYIGVKEGEELKAAALVLFRRLPLGFTLAYMPRGPLLDYQDSELLEFFTRHLKQFLRKKKAIECKIDPNLILGSYSVHEKTEAQSKQDQNCIQPLIQAGFRHHGYSLDMKETVQPRFQLCFQYKEDWQNVIPKKTRDKIKSSFHKGVQIDVKGMEGLHDLAGMIRYTEKRKNIYLRNEDYFKTMMQAFEGRSCILTASINQQDILNQYNEKLISLNAELARLQEGAPKRKAQTEKQIEDTQKEINQIQQDIAQDGKTILISSLLLVRDGRTCELLYSGLNEKYRRYLAAYALRFKAMEWAFSEGCQRFNFGGVQGSLDDGLFTFKSSFDPEIDVYAGEFDLPVMPLLYPIWSKALPAAKKIRKAMRRKR